MKWIFCLILLIFLNACSFTDHMAWRTRINGCHDTLSNIEAGMATFYDNRQRGNCDFPLDTHEYFAAMNSPQYEGSAICGACARIEGPKATITVRIVDSCPECPSNHLDLDSRAFAYIAEPRLGRIAIRFQFVPCPSANTIIYHYKEGSTPYWLGIQVRNHRLPIARLEYWRPWGIFDWGNYVDMTRADYNSFIAPGGFRSITNKIILRVTAIDGQQFTDRIPYLYPGQSFHGTGQFATKSCVK